MLTVVGTADDAAEQAILADADAENHELLGELQDAVAGHGVDHPDVLLGCAHNAASRPIRSSQVELNVIPEDDCFESF